jgi:ligand-binding sensor protein
MLNGSGVNVRPTDISLSFEHNTGTQPPQSHRADDSGNRKPNEFNIIRVVPRRPSPSPTESKSLSLDVNSQLLSPSSGYVSDASIGLSTPGTPATDFNDYVSKADIKPVLPTDNITKPKLITNGKLMQLNITADEATVADNCSDPFDTVRNSGQPVPRDKIVSNSLQSVPVVEYSPVLNVLLPEDQQTGNLTRTDPSSVQPGGVAYNSVEIADATSAKPVKSASVQVGVGATESASHDKTQPVKMLQTTGQPVLTETNMSSALQSVPVVQYSPVLNALQPDKKKSLIATESINLAEPSDVQQKALVCNTPLSEFHLDVVSGECTPQENDSKSFEKLRNSSQSASGECDLSQALQSVPVVEFAPVHEALQPEDQPATATSSATLAEPIAHVARAYVCNTPLAETQLDVTAGVTTHDHTEPVEIVCSSSQLASGVSDMATALQSVPVVEYSPALNALQPDHLHTGSLTVTLTDPTTAQHGVTSNAVEIADAASAKPVESASVQLGIGATETASHDHAQPVEMLQTTHQPTSSEADMSNALQSVPVVQYSPVLDALQPEDQPDKRVAMGSITLTEPSTVQPKAVVCNTPLSATQMNVVPGEVTLQDSDAVTFDKLNQPVKAANNLANAMQSVPVVEYSPVLNALQFDHQESDNSRLAETTTVQPHDVAYSAAEIADTSSAKLIKNASVQLGLAEAEAADHDHSEPVDKLQGGHPTAVDTKLSKALQSVPVVEYSPVLNALQPKDQLSAGSLILTDSTNVQPGDITSNAVEISAASSVNPVKTASLMQPNVDSHEITAMNSEPIDIVHEKSQLVPGEHSLSTAMQSVPTVEFSPVLNALQPEDEGQDQGFVVTDGITLTNSAAIQSKAIVYNTTLAEAHLEVAVDHATPHESSEPVEIVRNSSQLANGVSDMATALQSVPVVEYSPALNALQPDHLHTGSLTVTLTDPTTAQHGVTSNAVEIADAASAKPVKSASVQLGVGATETASHDHAQPVEMLQTTHQPTSSEADMSNALQSVPVVQYSPVLNALQPEDQPDKRVAMGSITLTEPSTDQPKAVVCNTPLSATQIETAAVEATVDGNNSASIETLSAKPTPGETNLKEALQSVPVVEYSPALNTLQPEEQQTGNVTLTDPGTVRPGDVAYNIVDIADATSVKPVKSASVQLGFVATETASHDHAQPVEMLQTTGQPTSSEADMSNALQSVPVVQYSPVLNALQPEDQPDKRVAMGSITLTEPSTVQPKAVVCNTPLSAIQMNVVPGEVTLQDSDAVTFDKLNQPVKAANNLANAMQSVPVVEYSPVLNALQSDHLESGKSRLAETTTVQPHDVAYSAAEIADTSSAKLINNASVQLGLAEAEAADHDHSEPVDKLQGGHPTAVDTKLSKALQSVPVVEYSPILNALQPKDQLSAGSLILTDSTNVQPGDITSNAVEISAASSANPVKTASLMQPNVDSHEITAMNSEPIDIVHEKSQVVPGEHSLSTAMQSVPTVEFSPVLNALQPEDEGQDQGFVVTDGITLTNSAAIQSKAIVYNTPLAEAHLEVAVDHATPHESSKPVEIVRNSSQLANGVSDMATALQSVPVVEYSPALNALQPDHLHTGSLTVTLTDPTTAQHGVTSNAVEIADAASAKPVKSASVQLGIGATETASHDHAQPVEMLQTTRQPTSSEADMSNALQSVPVVQYSPVLNALQPEDQPDKRVAMGSITLTEPSTVQPKAVVCNTPLSATQIETAAVEVTVDENNSASIEILSAKPTPGETNLKEAMQSVPVVEYSPALNALQPEEQQTGNVTLTDPGTVRPGDVAYNVVDIADATSVKPVKLASVQLGVDSIESASHDHAVPVEILNNKGQPVGSSAEIDMSNALQSIPVVEYSPVLNALQPDSENGVVAHDLTVADAKSFQPEAVECNVTNASNSSSIVSAKTAPNFEVEIEISGLELARPSSASDLDKQTGGDVVDNLARSDNNDKSYNDDEDGNEIVAVGGKAETVSVYDIASEQTRIIEVEICQLEIAIPTPSKNLVVVAEDGLNKLTDVANDGNLTPEENGLTKPHVNSEIVQLELAGEDGQNKDKDEDNKSLEDSVAAHTSSSDVDGKFA